MFGPTQKVTRVGLLVPASNAVMEVEFYRSLPDDITVHTSHIHRAQQNLSREALTEMADNARETALSLVALEPALIVYGHTASSYLGYMTVFAICGGTAFVAALLLFLVPKLAFADVEEELLEESNEAAALPE